MTRPDLFQRLVYCAFIVSLLLAPLPIHVKHARAAAPVLIGEVAWAGSSASTADEWLELWNVGDTDISLQGYSLVGAASKPIFLPDGASIPARGIYLVANYSDTDAKSVLAVPPQVVTSTVSLSNSALHITLVDTNGLTVDQAGDGKLPPAGSSGSTSTSMIRNGDTWTSATSSMGFDPGKNDLGTPGFCDGCPIVAPPVDPAPLDPPPLVLPEPDPIITNIDATTSIDTFTPTSTANDIVPDMTPSSTPQDIPLVIEDVLPPSSTDDALANNTSTDIENAIIIEAATTTDIENIETPSSTSDEPQSVPPVVTIPAEATPPTSTAPPAVQNYAQLRINEFMAQPKDEPEWIEVTNLDPAISVALKGVEIHDAVGKIYTFASGTVDGTTPYVRIFLSSSRLNNNGDTVSLHDPQGTLLDGVTYVSSEKNLSWSRSPDAAGPWYLTTKPTPQAQNQIIANATPPAVEPHSEPDEPTAVEENQTNDEDTQDEYIPEQKPVQILHTPIPATHVKPLQLIPKPLKKPVVVKKPIALKKTTTTTVKKAVAKTTAKKKVPTKKTQKVTKPITFAMLHQESTPGIHVSLRGTVGSPPSLLPSHAFVLLSQDGRGLLVRVPTNRKLPELGSMISVQGTLNFTDSNIPTLTIGKNDVWQFETENRDKPLPRTVDLLAPSNEDAWSFVQVTGTVAAIHGSTVTLDLQDTEADILIRPIIGYRVNRLLKGDTVTVRGLLDLHQDAPRLLPRQTTDIEIIKHVESKAAAQTSKTIPGWTPFGAAGVAIAGTEGLKQLRIKQKQRALEKVLRATTANLHAQ